MALISTVLFGTPQAEIAGLMNQKIAAATSVQIITGFATVEGVKVFEDVLRNHPAKLEGLVVGAGTYKAFEALDELIDMGVSNSHLFIHLGHTRLTKVGAKHSFYRYHPMLHSKIYYMEFEDGTACAFVGSHNVTGFALMGLNGEAAVLLEGQKTDSEFEKIRSHIAAAKDEAVVYHTEMKEAYAWWTNQFIKGLEQKSNDIPREVDKTKTILIFCECPDGEPQSNELLYFELRQALGRVQSTSAEIHLFIFDILPGSVSECLARIGRAKRSFWCTVEGIENDEGGRELTANWYIIDAFRPQLQQAPTPFRPTPQPGMQQIRVRLVNNVFRKYDYLFGKQQMNWKPVLREHKGLRYNQRYADTVSKLNLIPPETGDWFLVSDLHPEDGVKDSSRSQYEIALKAMEPESGSYILFSTGRRENQKETARKS